MIKVKEAVIVEGKYDKIKLSSIIDGLIIETNGFQIFKDKEKMKLIKYLADTRGILVLTDSDSAGFVIRNHLNGSVPKDKIKHAYIPDIHGKERRKKQYSKEGKIGVEGVDKKIIIDALKGCGVLCCDNSEKSNSKSITKIDLYEFGFSGREGSLKKRKAFYKILNLPENLSANAFLDIINFIMTYEEFCKIVNEIN